MKEQSPNAMIPLQPYVALTMDRYQMQMAGQYGISHFYTFEKNVQNEGKLLSVPDGSVDLLFGLMGSRVHCFISGTVLRAKRWPLGGCDRYFGLRFMPGSVILPKDLSIEDLVDRDLEIRPEIYGTRLAGELLQAASLPEQARLFLESYARLLPHDQDRSATQALENYITIRICECRGNISMAALSEETGYSPAYIRRTFKGIHGISPKKFQRIVRFQSLLHQMDTLGGPSYGGAFLPEDTGYYDQSHLIKDFKNFTGLTPQTYAAMIACTPLPA